MRLPLLCALLALTAPTIALAQGVVCDAKVMRIVKNLRDEPMTPDQAERARQALYAAIDKCRPLSSGSSTARQHERLSQGEPPPDTRLERQSWRNQQSVLNPAEQREGERRLDAIDRKAQSDPRAARDMQRIWQADEALGTLNRPPPGGPSPLTPGSPSLVGPGDRH